MASKRKPLTDADGDVRELTKEDFARMVPLEQLPKEHQEAWRAVRRRGPQKAPTKERISLRLSREVLEHYKAGGAGWQTRIDDTLRALMAKGSPRPALSSRGRLAPARPVTRAVAGSVLTAAARSDKGAKAGGRVKRTRTKG